MNYCLILLNRLSSFIYTIHVILKLPNITRPIMKVPRPGYISIYIVILTLIIFEAIRFRKVLVNSAASSPQDLNTVCSEHSKYSWNELK